MLHATNQGYQYRQPWNKKNPSYSSGFAVYLGNGLFLTNAGVVEHASFLELLSSDGSKTVMATVKAADYEANLAILEAKGDMRDNFLQDLVPVELAQAPSLGDAVEIWQFNGEGLPLVTSGVLESTQQNVPFTYGISFVLYQIKTAVNVVTGGATMPVMIDGKLAGMTLSCDTSEQCALSLTTPVVKSFLDRALGDKPYEGIPVFGVQTVDLMDPVFRTYLKLPERNGGVYVLKVTPFSPADMAGMKEGDVIKSVNGMPIDGRGIVRDDKLGPVSASFYLHDLTKIGDKIDVEISRDGEILTLQADMTRDALDKALIPPTWEPGQPGYLVYGGLVFQPMTRPYLSEVFGGNPNKMPLEFLDAMEHEEEFRAEGRDEIILLTSVLPTPATHGYNNYGFSVIRKVNGEIPRDMEHLARLLDDPGHGDMIRIETNKAPHIIYFSRKEAENANAYITQMAFPRLRNL